MGSVWSMTCRLPFFPALEGDLTADVLVIGGGMAGLLCAYELSRAGVDCALIEQDRICSGVTQNTTAKLTVQHGLIYSKLIRQFGPERAGMYLAANRAALERYRELCQTIDCGFEEQPSVVYSLGDRAGIDRELKALQSLGCPARLLTELPLPFPVAGAVEVPDQAQFHPLLFAAGILPGLRIYEKTRALEWRPGAVRTPLGTVRAQKVIVATHFPIFNNHGGFFLKLYQSRSYVLALEGVPAPKGMYVDASGEGLSFRSWDGLLLLGGGGHRTGKKGGGWKALSGFARREYDGAREVSRWATQDCMSLDGAPYIGQYSKSTPDLFVATGFNKWGMTSSMVAAMVLRDLVQGRESPYAPVFSPTRAPWRKQLAVNVLDSAAGLLTPTVPRCPHMGCALKYNAQERSWDCPCHGSRFAESGALLDGPATGNKQGLK